MIYKKMKEIYRVNSHMHTPFSFSAFDSIEQIFRMAVEENIKVAGINDFFTTEGYEEFGRFAGMYKVYPLFNIEFIGLSKEFQEKGIRINDPNNPGRIYISGKGLQRSFHLSPKNALLLERVQEESQKQVIEMISKANAFFRNASIPLSLDYTIIKQKYAKNLVRERHIAKAICEAIVERAGGVNEHALALLKSVYNGIEPAFPLTDRNAVENEIRSRLLKSGGTAFIPEDESAFLSVDQINDIILDAGGIPCYPVLLDDAKGNFTDFEADPGKMHSELVKMKFGMVELIPNRNNATVLEEFVKFFRSRNFPVCLGTEHNSPGMIPLLPSCRGNVPLSAYLDEISYESACIIAAHQELVSANRNGFSASASMDNSRLEELAREGHLVIKKFIS